MHQYCPPFARLVIALTLTIASVAAAPPAPPATTTSSAKAKPPANLPDAVIERDIRARLARSKIGRNGFQVRVQGGVATFEGKASVIQHKGAATRMAKAAGARAVVNNIVISEEARQRAAANLASGRRRAQLHRDNR